MKLAQRLEQATQYLKLLLMANAPKDTGNLAFNGIQVVQLSPNRFQIVIGNELVNYAVYTNVRNRSSIGWVENTIEQARPTMAMLMSGAIDLDDVSGEVKNQIDAQLQMMVERERAKQNAI